MPSKYGNATFYNSKEWRRVSVAYMVSKNYVCERCGAPARVCHHKKWLNGSNVHNPEISLSFDNLEALCYECHAAEHGLTHDIMLFDEEGNVKRVKESVATREYKRSRDQIDDVVGQARRLSSVVSCEETKK